MRAKNDFSDNLKKVRESFRIHLDHLQVAFMKRLLELVGFHNIFWAITYNIMIDCSQQKYYIK